MTGDSDVDCGLHSTNFDFSTYHFFRTDTLYSRSILWSARNSDEVLISVYARAYQA